MLSSFRCVACSHHAQNSSGVANLDLMLGHTFYKTMLSYWHAGSYVHLYMVVVQKVHGVTNYC